MTPKAIEKLARKLALAEINAARTADGMKPAARVSPLWWRLYGAEWIAKASKDK